MHGGLRQGKAGLGHPDQLDRLRRGDGGLQRCRVGQPDVLTGVHQQPPRDEPRVLPSQEHAGQVMQRGVGV